MIREFVTKNVLQILTATVSFKINLNLPTVVCLVFVISVVIVTVFDFGMSVIIYTRVTETRH